MSDRNIWTNIKTSIVKFCKFLITFDGARFLVPVIGLIHLFLCSIQNNAILKLSNVYAGIIMFGFILGGLVALFFATRCSSKNGSQFKMFLGSIILTLLIALLLVYIYVNAILNQKSAVIGPMINATILSSLVIAGYIYCLVILLIKEKKYVGSSRDE